MVNWTKGACEILPKPPSRNSWSCFSLPNAMMRLLKEGVVLADPDLLSFEMTPECFDATITVRVERKRRCIEESPLFEANNRSVDAERPREKAGWHRERQEYPISCLLLLVRRHGSGFNDPSSGAACQNVVWVQNLSRDSICSTMRVNLIAKTPAFSVFTPGACPVSLTIKPSYGLAGDYEYQTDTASLMKMLRRRTDLHEPVLQRFSRDLQASTSAKLLGVNLTDQTLEEIGYFID